MTPSRLIILHLGQRFLTDACTFTVVYSLFQRQRRRLDDHMAMLMRRPHTHGCAEEIVYQIPRLWSRPFVEPASWRTL